MASPSRLPSLRRPAGSSRPVSMIEGPMMNAPILTATSNDSETSKKAKRRSLLPQFSWKGSNEERAASVASDESQDSGVDNMKASENTRVSPDIHERRAVDEVRTKMPPPKMARPMSMIPPRGSSQTSRLKTHARNVSTEKVKDKEISRAESLAALTGTSTNRPAVQEGGLQRSGSTRLPQTARPGAPMIPSRTTSARPPGSRGKASNRHSVALGASSNSTLTADEMAPSKLRAPAVKASPQKKNAEDVFLGQFSHDKMIETTSRISPPRPLSSLRPRPASQIIPPSSKPAFTTYQQHYSPAKSSLPKPPIPSAKHARKPSSVPDEEPLDFEVTKQQIELLQLSLLHQSTEQCNSEYTASAKKKLSKMHSKLGKEYESLRATELIRQRANNLSALDTWCPDTALLIENMQILSLVHSDLSVLMEEGSRHDDVAAMFELWMNEAETAESGNFIEPLSADWRSMHGILVLKLRSIQRNLRVLPHVVAGAEPSGVEIVLRACKMLVEDMLKELEIMLKLEKEMLEKEKGRLDREVDGLLRGSNVGMGETWKPAWQVCA